MERDVGFDLDVGLDPGRRGIFDRHAGEHVSQVDAVAQDTSSIGKFGPRVDTGLERLGGDADRDLVAVSDEQADRVGQVELALGVVRLDPVERRPELLGPEHVDRGVRLLELELRRGRVAGLDDPLEASGAVAHEPAVVPGIVVLDAEHRGCGAGGEVRVEQLAQHLGGQQHGVAGEDEDVLGTALERGASRPDRVARAARHLLHRDLVALEVAARLRRGDDDDRVGADLTVPHGAPSRPSGGRAPDAGASVRRTASGFRGRRP